MKWPKFTKKEKIERNIQRPSFDHFMSSFAIQETPSLTKQEVSKLYQEGILGDLISEITAPIRSIENFYITGHDNSEAIKYLQEYGKIKFSCLLTELAIDCHLFGFAAIFVPAVNIRKLGKLQYYRLPAYNLHARIFNNKKQWAYTNAAGQQYQFVHEYGKKHYSSKMQGFLIVIDGYNLNIAHSAGLPPNRIKNELRYLNELGLKNIRQMQGVSLDYAVNIPEGQAVNPNTLASFKESFLKKYQGGDGERVIFAVGDGKIQPISQTNREAEYLQTAQEFIKRCYNWAKIPLALRTTEASTYNNFNIAKYSLIMDAVFPTLALILQNIHDFFLHFWPYEKGKFWFNESDIPVMKDKREEEILNLFKNGLLSEDEARERLGIKV